MRKSQLAPRRLGPDDLAAVRALAGDAALEYVGVIGGFHFINRIADLLHVDSEALPDGLRRFETLRRFSVRVAAWLIGGMDLRNRSYPGDFEDAVARFASSSPGRSPEELRRALASLAPRPQLVETLALGREELLAGSLAAETRMRVFRGVEAALPSSEEEATGFHPRPGDPFDAFVFVGTRYPSRATEAMLDALRARGYDDVGLLDLATAVAEANAWARIWRLADLDPALLDDGAAPRDDRTPAAAASRA